MGRGPVFYHDCGVEDNMTQGHHDFKGFPQLAICEKSIDSKGGSKLLESYSKLVINQKLMALM